MTEGQLTAPQAGPARSPFTGEKVGVGVSR